MLARTTYKIGRLVEETHHFRSKIYVLLVALSLLFSIPLSPALGEPEGVAPGSSDSTIANSQRDLAIAVRDYEGALTQTEKSRRSIKLIAEQVDASNRQLEEAKKIYNKRMELYYRNGPISIIEFIFSAKTPYEFSSRMDMMANLGQQDLALINEVTGLQNDLNDRLKILGQKYQSQSRQKQTLASRRRMIEEQLRLEQERLNSVKQLGSIDGAMIASLPEKRDMPSRDIDPAQRAMDATQMIFPIDGAHAFCNTWGAPRSGGRHHQGTDIYANRGMPCVAVRDGVISTISTHGLAGLYVRLIDGDGTMYAYIHLDAFAEGLFEGQPVKQGDVVGYVGNTGNASGGACHLHFEIHPNGGGPVNPYPYLTNADI